MIPGSESIPTHTFIRTPIAVADFVNDAYTYQGSTVAASDVFVDSSPTLLSGHGLQIVGGALPIPVAGDFKAVLMTTLWTARFTLNVDPTGHNTFLVLYNEFGAYGYENWLYADVWGGTWEAEDINDDYGPIYGSGRPNDRYVHNWFTGQSPGDHVLVLTRTDQQLSLSIDGSNFSGDGQYANVDQAQNLNMTPFTPPWTTGEPLAHIGGWGGFYGSANDGSFYLKKLEIFAPQRKLVLPLLSAQ